MAAGVPKPDAPSSMKAKAQPITINCATGLGLIPANHCRNVCSAPEMTNTRFSNIAPAIMDTGVNTASPPAIILANKVCASAWK